jgi:hypothetical protein
VGRSAVRVHHPEDARLAGGPLEGQPPPVGRERGLGIVGGIVGEAPFVSPVDPDAVNLGIPVTEALEGQPAAIW